jgi:hypothetical protein
MHLQDALKEHENEIALLEESLKATESKANGFPTSVPHYWGQGLHSCLVSTSNRIWGDWGIRDTYRGYPDYEDTSGRTTPISSPIPPMDLSPKMMNQLRVIRRSLDFSGLIKFDTEDSAPPLGQDNLLGRLNELMRWGILLSLYKSDY